MSKKSDNQEPGSSARMVAIKVGLPHPFWQFLPPQDGMRAVYLKSGVNLVITLNRCSDADITSFQDDGMKFGMVRMNGGYCWLLRTGFCTFDAPYSPCIEEPEMQAGPWFERPHTLETRLAVNMHVIDGRGIARALKLVSVSPDFTRKMMATHALALKSGVTRAEWDAEVDAHFRRYPNPRKAFDVASATTKGGD